jgi:hypothetical protein
MIDSGNNHLYLDLIRRWRELRPDDIVELTKRRPDWQKELERSHLAIQEAMEPVNEIACEIEDILVQRERQQKTAA